MFFVSGFSGVPAVHSEKSSSNTTTGALVFCAFSDSVIPNIANKNILFFID
jgi:hypothetical protein